MTQVSLSVVICTHNRADNIPTVLASLFSQKLGQDQQLEIIVVPNGCSDDTVNVLRDLIRQSPVPLICSELKEGNLSAARNTGVNTASNSVIAFLDDDVRVLPDWAINMGHVFASDHVDIVGGKVELWFRDIDEPDWLDHYHRRLLSENIRGEELRHASVADILGCNFAVRKELFSQLAGFNSELGRQAQKKSAGEEADFVYRALGQGYRAWYAPSVRVEHLVTAERLTADYLCKCAFGAGRAYSSIYTGESYDVERILDLATQLIEIGTKEAITETNNRKQYMYYHTRRWHLYGELAEALKVVFGNESPHPTLRRGTNITGYRELQAALRKLSHFPPTTQPPQTLNGSSRLLALARASQLQRFGGETSPITVQLPEPVSPPYAIEVACLADPREGRIYHSFSDISPPMPLLASPALGIYQTSVNDYSIGLAPGAQFRFEHTAGEDWFHLGISVTAELEARLYINGNYVANFRYSEIADATICKLVIGGGYMKRAWDGWLAHLRIGRTPLREMGFTPVLRPSRDESTLIFYNGYSLEK